VLESRRPAPALSQEKTYFLPGSKFRYSNTGYAVLSLIVEVRSGMPFAQFLKKNIFKKPLKMTNSLAYEQGLSIIPNRRPMAIRLPVKASRAPTKVLPVRFSVMAAFIPQSPIFMNGTSSLYDEAGECEMAEACFYARSLPTDFPNSRYGFGWYIGEYRGLKEIWHYWRDSRIDDRIARFPEKKFTLVILTNRNDAKISELPHKITDLCLFP